MQVKQQSLLKRVDALDKECEELHGQLGKWREKHYDLQHQLRQMSEEKEEVQMQLASQQVCLVTQHVACSMPSSANSNTFS